MEKFDYIKDFSQIHKDDIASVGGKGANLGEMTVSKFPVPSGFVVTAKAYYLFLRQSGLKEQLKALLGQINSDDPRSFQDISRQIQHLITQADFPPSIAREIFHAYEQLSGLLRSIPVAVRSSATAEDLPGASFAGQQATYLNITGEANLVQKVRLCWASLFTPRAIFYRQQKGFDHFKVGIAVVVQKMIQSQSSGVLFTLNPVTNDKRAIIIEAIWGLGELIVQGAVTPDHFEVDKISRKIVKKYIAKQTEQLTRDKDGKTRIVRVPENLQEKQKIPDTVVLQLADLGKKVHQHYFYPQDIEWAWANNQIYLIQTRPVTTIEKNDQARKNQEAKKTSNLTLLIKGDSASPGIGCGFSRLIKSSREINQVKLGEVMITEMTTPDFVPAMRKVSAIVTDKGGQTSHAAIVSRELGIPCVVGTEKATRIIKNGQVITVNGQTGEVFKGGLLQKSPTLAGDLNPENSQPFPVTAGFKLRTATKLYVNLAEPDLAGKIAKLDVDGVGLLRAEFMIANIGIHPRKLIKDGKKAFFVDKLTEGLQQFCQAFSPRPVVYRTTDFKSNEYANLTGGKEFEPVEANPLLGYRGAFRYVADEAVFSLELEAIKKVRNKFNLKNLHIMIPFVRTVKEMQEVKKIIAVSGLTRSPTFKIWMMVEIPSNVILLEEFIKAGIDGVSIGSNDLTMLLLGLDRDNEQVAKDFDERNPAVLWALEKVIKTCHQHKITSSICGQAPSQYPELTQKLVSWGITSVSVTPDMIETTRKIIYQAEGNLALQKHGQNR